MKLQQLETPAILVRTEVMKRNLRAYQEACRRHGKALWPMTKTHKSSRLAQEQYELGAEGFLCGTLDECEALAEKGLSNIMYAYPVADPVSCDRVAALAEKCRFYSRIDTPEAAAALNEAAGRRGVVVDYTIIIDCGLHRFGVEPGKAVALADALKGLKNLRLRGVSTHPGHVYGESDPEKISHYAEDEMRAVRAAAEALRTAGYPVDLVTSGSTPTFWGTLEDACIQVYHPGNYIFNDCIQIANGTAGEDDCALLVYATVISRPRADLLICDAGAKCLGLDTGAHGNDALKGHGCVLGHPELEVAALSEEVGKLRVLGETDVKVGDRIRIIPNHACAAANLTGHYILVGEDDEVEEAICVDIRGNASRKGLR